MTAKELNRDIKRLYKKVQTLKDNEYEHLTEDYLNIVDNEIKPEYRRLYFADREFKYMNKQSVLIMLSLNNAFRFIELHQFGLYIQLDS